MRVGIAFFAMSLALVEVPTRAGADEKQACLQASDRGQQFKLDGKLMSAREQLLLCARPECPKLVRDDCAQWMTEVLAALPSVVFGARDAQGHDVMTVRVSVDGNVVAEKLDGKPMPIDPGAHTVKYETAGMSAVEEQVLVREGEKNRSLTVTFPAPPGAKTTASPGSGSSSPGKEEPPTTKGPISPVAWVLGGIGVLALGSALYFDLTANGDVNDLRTTCAPNCTSSQVDPVRTKYVISGISLGVGIVSLGVATYLILARPSQPAAEAHATSWRVDFAPEKGGGVAQVGGRF